MLVYVLVKMFSPCFCLILFMLINPLVSQSFHRLDSKEYHVEVQSSVKGFSEAVGKCAQINATLAIVDSQVIKDFLLKITGNLTSKDTNILF